MMRRGGDSTMHRQGEVYTAPPNMKAITMKEHWRWLPREGVKYLDVSCLIFDADMRHIGVVDYRNQYAPRQSYRLVNAII